MPEYDVGDVVEIDGEVGLVVSLIEEDTEWFPDPDDDDEGYEIEATPEEPVYLVALESGDTVPFGGQQLEDGEWPDVEVDEDPEEIEDDIVDAELSEVYHRVDDPANYEEFENALAELASPAIDLPGANTAGIGFATDPPGWNRSSYLKAWRTFRGKWRVCYPRMIRHFGPRMAKRWCSALKDEVYQTTKWRNRGW